MEELFVSRGFGSEIKLLEGDKIGGHLVLFSDENSPDLMGDYFNKSTDFGIENGAKTAVYLNHRLPLKTAKGGTIAVKEKIGEGTLSIDDTGVLIEAILFNRKKYEKALTSMGWSSGSAAHLVDREKNGKAHFIKSWPLGLDASVTPIPCEPRTSVLSLKSYEAEIKDIFTELMAERDPSFWEMNSLVCEGAKRIAQASETSDISGATVDVAAKVNELVDGYASQIKPLIVAQINDYISYGEGEFYLKGNPFNAILDSEGNPLSGIRFADHLDSVLTAVSGVSRRTKQFQETGESVKAGRKISTARRAKLQAVLDELVKLMDDTAPAEPKSVDPELVMLLADFERNKFARLKASIA